jgi:hypothetical protein
MFFRKVTDLVPEHAGARKNLALLGAVLGNGSETSSMFPSSGFSDWKGADGGQGAAVSR